MPLQTTGNDLGEVIYHFHPHLGFLMNDVIEIGTIDHQNLTRAGGYSRSSINKRGNQERPTDYLTRGVNIIMAAFLETNGNSPVL